MPKGLSGNQLKLIAVITMTVDHIGAFLYPQVLWLRMVGRLAYHIFAYMIAEGCTHTRSMPRYLGTMAAMAAVCQVTMYAVIGSLHQYILVAFTLSIGLIWLLRLALEKKHFGWWTLALLGIAGVWFVTQVLPYVLRDTDFAVDYGFWGVMLPVAVWLVRKRWHKLLMTAAVLLLVAGDVRDIQMLALCALPLLALYNGQRGKRKLKYFFYLYFPAHIVILEVIALLTKQ